MHGIIFLALEDFLESRCGEGAWAKAMQGANLVEQRFSPDRFYPDEGATDLFAASAHLLGITQAQTLEQLGQHMSTGLLAMGRSMGLIQDEWRTLDILEHLSKDILSAFGNASTGVKPPDIRTYRLKQGEVAVAYLSARKLCALFKGIVLGMGAFFGEPVRIEERVCLLNNAPLCRLSVYLDDPNLKNRVDIVREFQTVHSRIQEIRFFNRFAGIPIVNQGLVLQYGAEEVLIQIQAESLMAMHKEGITHLALPHLPSGLQATVVRVEWRSGTATLRHIVSTDGPMGRRVSPRVAPNHPIAVECRMDKQTLRGWMANLSDGGLCIVLNREPLPCDAVMFAPIKVRFALPVQMVDTRTETDPVTKIVLDGNILHIDEKEERHHLRIVFRPLSVNDAHLVQAYYHGRRQYALRHLRAMIAETKQ